MKLYKHQKEAVKKAKGRSYCIFHETGTGKSITAYELVKDFKKVMVVCPKMLIRMWQELLPDAYVINREKLIRRKFEANEYYQALIVDESQMLKNPKSKISKLLYKNRARFRVVYCLSGTPAPNSDQEYYGQLRMVVRNVPNEVEFNSRFFGLTRQGKIVSYPPNPGEYFRTGWKMITLSKDVFKRYVSQYADFCSKEDCLDLPKKLFVPQYFDLNSKERKAHDEMKRHLYTEVEGVDIAVENEMLKLAAA